MAVSKKFIPGSEVPAEEIFQYPFFLDEESKEFIKNHGTIMFIVRGLPGTGKSSLNDLILYHYPSSVKCCADDYFTKTFTSGVRSRETLKKSHLYCYNRVKQECVKGSHPIVVTNTHVQRMEMQEYLKYAQDYGYTVIIVSTLDKFEVSPKILADSNTKGLDTAYFERRMKKWQEILPLLMGWFLCREDSCHVFHHLHKALDTLVGDPKFCRVFSVFDKESFLNEYKAKEILFCIAGYWKSSPFELKEYYKSNEVREAYGKSFRLSILAYVITESDIFAIVWLDDTLKSLLFEPGLEHPPPLDAADDLVGQFSRLSLRQPYYKFKWTSLNGNYFEPQKGRPATASLGDKSRDYLDIRESSFVHLARRDEGQRTLPALSQALRSAFEDGAEKVPADRFEELDGGYKVCRLRGSAWVVVPPKDLSVRTVFTGLYL